MVDMKRRTDRDVLDDVIAALKAAPVDELAITPVISNGVVTLKGQLSSYSERLAATTAARHAAGHAPVVSELTVAPVGQDSRMTDADIAVEVARAIVDSDIPPGDVWFDVANRIVTLAGTVATAADRARIRHLVQNARGVHFIDNRIVVGTPTRATR